jgi:DNA-binding transcriptional LysR family regulator
MPTQYTHLTDEELVTTLLTQQLSPEARELLARLESCLDTIDDMERDIDRLTATLRTLQGRADDTGG